jgi:hypothetical protein
MIKSRWNFAEKLPEPMGGEPPSDDVNSIRGVAQVMAANLAKLIPGEALALYAAKSIDQTAISQDPLRTWPVFCLLATIIFRWFAAQRAGALHDTIKITTISAITFVLWVYSQNDWFLTFRPEAAAKSIIGEAFTAWVVLAPFFAGEHQKG